MLYDLRWEQKITTPAWRSNLLRAADLIRKHGLAKGIRRTSDGALCIHGAISMAVTGDAYGVDDCEESSAVCRYLLKQGAPHVHEDGAAYWNNMAGRTIDEVVAALEGAARTRQPPDFLLGPCSANGSMSSRRRFAANAGRTGSRNIRLASATEAALRTSEHAKQRPRNAAKN